MRVLGVDWGERRIGLALGDTETRIASPWRTLINPGGPQAAAAVGRLAVEEGVGAVVIGFPKTLKGEEGHMAHLIEDFSGELRESVDVPIYLEDERLSSALADRQREQGSRSGRDALAAAVVLETWLAKRR